MTEKRFFRDERTLWVLCRAALADDAPPERFRSEHGSCQAGSEGAEDSGPGAAASSRLLPWRRRARRRPGTGGLR